MKLTQLTRCICKLISVLAVLLSLCAGRLTGPVEAQSGHSLESLHSFPPNSYPNGLVYGPQGALWLALGGANSVGRLDLGGSWLPAGLAASARPFDITIGPDAALWFTEQAGNAIGRLDPGGGVTEYPLPAPGRYPASIALGQDGGLWFTEYLGNRICRLDLDGTISEYLLPGPNSQPLGITSALDGALWFTEWNTRRIGKILPGGQIEEYPITGSTHRPTEIALGPDGALWFIFDVGETVMRLDPGTGEMTPYALPVTQNGSSSFFDLATGPDGRLWLLGTGSVTRLSFPLTTPPAIETLDISDVVESGGRSQIIAGPGAEMFFISGNSQEVWQVNLETASLRDVQVFVHPFPEVMLMGGAFQVDVEIANWSSAPATGVALDFPLAENTHFLSTIAPGLSCAETGGHAYCSLASLAGGQRVTIPFFFSFDKISGERVSRSFEVKVNMNEADTLAANNRAFRGLTFQRSIKYFNDFSAGADEYWSETLVTSLGDGLKYLGGFSNQEVHLAFPDLPHHDRVDLCFDLYVLGGWDGETMVDPMGSGDPLPVIGPDLWAYYVDEAKVKVTTFSNVPRLSQSFPSEYNEGIFPAQHRAAAVGNFDTDPAVNDSRYHLCVSQLHGRLALNTTFYGTNLDALTGEKWALDNVSVQVYYRAAFDWLHLPVLLR